MFPPILFSVLLSLLSFEGGIAETDSTKAVQWEPGREGADVGEMEEHEKWLWEELTISGGTTTEMKEAVTYNQE